MVIKLVVCCYTWCQILAFTVLCINYLHYCSACDKLSKTKNLCQLFCAEATSATHFEDYILAYVDLTDIALLLFCRWCLPAFGLTEASPGTHCHTDDDVKYHTVGVAMQNTQYKVLATFMHSGC